MSLENLFKYKLPIKFSLHFGDKPINNSQDPCDFVYSFESERIHDPKKNRSFKTERYIRKIKTVFQVSYL